MHKLDSKGFTVIEAALIVIVIGILTGVGFYVFQTKKATNSTYDHASQALTGVKPAAKKASSANAISDQPSQNQSNSPQQTSTKPNSTTNQPPSSPSNTVTGKVAGHVFASCGNPPSGCRSQAGIPGVIMTLTDSSGKQVGSTTTDGDGYYTFSAAPGIYTISESLRGSSVKVQIQANITTTVNF
jgi:Tfp pilus assembly major pilin PilA